MFVRIPTWPTWIIAACALVGIGCGGPSPLDLCHATCESSRRCGISSDATAANCRTSCDNNKGALEDQQRRDDANCKNAASVRSASLNCLQQECNKIITCQAQLDRTCVK